MSLTEMGWEDRECFNVVEDGDKWQTVMNRVLKLEVS
jgi:hypothetical protein